MHISIAKIFAILLLVFAILLEKCNTVLQVFAILLKSIASICNTFQSIAPIPAADKPTACGVMDCQ